MATTDTACFRCSMCYFFDASYRKFCTHMVRCHKHDPHFTVTCGFQLCSFVTKSWSSFKMHVRRKHSVASEHTESDVYNYCYEDVDVLNETVKTCPSKPIILSASHLLFLEAENRLTARGVDGLISSTADLLSLQASNITQQIQQQLSDNGFQAACAHVDGVIPLSFFNGLESQYKRHKFYKAHFGLVEPCEIYMGSSLRKYRGRIEIVRKYGTIVPFETNLKALLSLPEVWNFVQHPHLSCSDVMRDICDGFVWHNNALFSRNPYALQIFLNTDDIEIVNPIGAHTKKHKLTMFYFTLGNIPPQFRSRLSSVQLLAIARTRDVRQFGVRILLNDFFETVSRLASGGISCDLHGSTHLIEGTLLLVCADTPAAHWLGGFKEGVGFSRKVCRACDASDLTIKASFNAYAFHERMLADHLKRCDDLQSLTKDAFRYWSREWGINSKSFLCDIPHFDLCTSMVQDPMHLLLEGVVPYVFKLFLCYCICDAKFFSLDWLNEQLQSFSYSYLESDKPEPILSGDLLVDKKLKQTSAAMLTLCRVIPYIIGTKLSPECDKWINFLRLIQITFLATCPYATADTAGCLSQLVETHNLLFCKHYPRASVTPKMHYLIHLPKQLLRFGPLRHHWCLRFEAKHAFFKSIHSKCFKNVSKTLAKKHQIWMCHKQLGIFGSRNPNFLYDGDIVAEGEPRRFSDVFPCLDSHFMSLTSCEMAYFTNSVQIQGTDYRIGCVLVLAYDFTGLPEFAVIRSICVHKEIKYFALEHLEVQYFEPSMICYVVVPSGTYKLVCYVDLSFPLPLAMHSFNGKLCVVNWYAYESEFLI